MIQSTDGMGTKIYDRERGKTTFFFRRSFLVFYIPISNCLRSLFPQDFVPEEDHSEKEAIKSSRGSGAGSFEQTKTALLI